MLGDTLKVFHFIASVRREHVYMYKHVIERELLGDPPRTPAFKISHLNLSPFRYYRELIDGRVMKDVEIVQGYDKDGTPHKDRPKMQPSATAEKEESS